MVRIEQQGGFILKLNKGVLFILLGASFFGFTPIFAKLGFSYGYSLGQINIVQMVISLFLLWFNAISARFIGHHFNVPIRLDLGEMGSQEGKRDCINLNSFKK